MLMKEFSGIKNHDNFQKADGINWMEGHLRFLKYHKPEGGTTYNSSGSPAQWMTHAKGLKPGEKVPGSMMRRVVNLEDIKAGCILMNEKHLMIAMGTVQPNGNLKVADSTSIPHGPKDKRHNTPSGNGMGKGYIVVRNAGGSNGFEMKRSTEFANWSNSNTLKMYVLKPVV